MNKQDITHDFGIAAMAVLLTAVITLNYSLSVESHRRAETPPIVTAAPEPEVPPYIENIVRRLDSGRDCSDIEMEALSSWIEAHPVEWNAWSHVHPVTIKTF